MVQLNLLSDKSASCSHEISHFPCVIGRAPSADVRLEHPGVWDRHAQLELNPREGFVLSALPGAILRVNAQATERAALRNGDVVELGAAKLQFWLGRTRQRRFRHREWLLWGTLALISAGQIVIIYQLAR